jgi:carbamoyl-phosphate synthase large subunit
LKSKGFSDARLAQLAGTTEAQVRRLRRGLNVRPAFKRIDTCAAEFASATAYMYSTYETGALGQVPQCESNPSDRKKAIILGGGPNRIGQGIEFDYCCCHAAFAFADIGVESIMVNCNPETVSTDYDTSDRLYFEPLTAEDVLELIEVERSTGNLIGVVVQFGGQTPLKLAHALHEDGVPILGTSLDSIDLAEDRERFQVMLHDIGLMQPPNGLARSAQEAADKADEVGYPVVLRPSYVLGGRGMVIVHDREQLDRYVGEAMRVSGDDPVLIDHYLNRATEVDVDALCDDETVFVAGVLVGADSMSRAVNVPTYIADVIVAVSLISMLVATMLTQYRVRRA